LRVGLSSTDHHSHGVAPNARLERAPRSGAIDEAVSGFVEEIF
jgi:hypothetical protein